MPRLVAGQQFRLRVRNQALCITLFGVAVGHSSGYAPYMFPYFPYLSSRLKVVLSARNSNFGGQIPRIHDSHIEHYFKGDLKTLASRVMLAMAKEKVKIITETKPMQSTTSNQNGSECWIWQAHAMEQKTAIAPQKSK